MPILSLPLLALRGIVVFPHTETEIEIGRKKSTQAVKIAVEKFESQMILVSQINDQVEDPKPGDLYKVGTLVSVTSSEPDNEGIKIKVTGLKRVVIKKITGQTYLKADYEISTLDKYDEKDINVKIEEINTIFEDIYRRNAGSESSDKTAVSENSISAEIFTDQIAAALRISAAKKQELLEESSVAKRLELLIAETKAVPSIKRPTEESNVAANKVNSEIDKKVSDNLNKQQREFYLRERLRAIKEELGELHSKDNDIDTFRTKLGGGQYPEAIAKRIKDELNRFEAMPPASQEASMIKTYIEWLMDVPWWQKTEDNDDILKVKAVLDTNHYGLEKVKERILEYLAVRIKSKNMKGPIICLVGPPGVGKTSLAKSIADSLNKKFVKVSLGGVRDEAEIRGHRKTYLGSMPGRIIQAMKKAGVINPLFLLDEIDKMSSDARGDPSSAMLEVLDPEQNKLFSDNYLEEEYDLSKVMFLATANYYEQIPHPLLDRMEIIELSSYTSLEKLQIAKDHLVPKIMEDTGSTKQEIKFDDKAINYIINLYTREAGVRDLERVLAKIFRKFIVMQQKEKLASIKIDVNMVKQYLGKEVFEVTEKDKVEFPGVVNGMAYTTVGGDLLPIEVTLFPGKGNILITGNLKETMKESANVALGYVRHNADRFMIDHRFFKEYDFHIHVPQGGVPKDGPSAGSALTTAIISAITKQVVNTKIAMTGEITLRGKVLPIGGLKEKVISAHRGGVRTIFIPFSNERHLEDIPKEVLKDMQVNLVHTYDEIYATLFKPNTIKPINIATNVPASA